MARNVNRLNPKADIKSFNIGDLEKEFGRLNRAIGIRRSNWEKSGKAVEYGPLQTPDISDDIKKMRSEIKAAQRNINRLNRQIQRDIKKGKKEYKKIKKELEKEMKKLNKEYKKYEKALRKNIQLIQEWADTKMSSVTAMAEWEKNASKADKGFIQWMRGIGWYDVDVDDIKIYRAFFNALKSGRKNGLSSDVVINLIQDMRKVGVMGKTASARTIKAIYKDWEKAKAKDAVEMMKMFDDIEISGDKVNIKNFRSILKKLGEN